MCKSPTFQKHGFWEDIFNGKSNKSIRPAAIAREGSLPSRSLFYTTVEPNAIFLGVCMYLPLNSSPLFVHSQSKPSRIG